MPVAFDYIRDEGKNKRISHKLMAIVTEGGKGRLYFSPIAEHEKMALSATPSWKPETSLPEKALSFRVQLYGMTNHADLFTQRQLLALSTFCELADEVKSTVNELPNSKKDYALAVKTYLSFAIDKGANIWSTISSWMSDRGALRETFARQALPMVWDYAEANPFSDSGGNFGMFADRIADVIEYSVGEKSGNVKNIDATKYRPNIKYILSTDPPYYDNIGYADLSDYFYVWLRRCLSEDYPDLFETVLVPKKEELIATPFRFNGDKQKANEFFENGLRQVFMNANETTDANYPATVYYAFKQSESESDGDDDQSELIETRASTGWETMLEGLLSSGFELTGTWPVRTEGSGRMIAKGTNALATSIVLVCRPRPQNASSASRREFLGALKKELAPALRELQQGSIAPVDLAQASIGPGMAVYSRYSAVLEADGKPMSVRTALGLINQALDEYLTEQEGEYDSDTRWALSWFEQFGHNEAAYGVAETLSKAKNTSIEGLVEAGILEARAGKVRLLKRDELDTEWDPARDKRLTAWESAAHLIYALENGGEESAAGLLVKLGPIAETARDLAYRLYTVCERKGWSQDALGFNMLVVAWPRLKELSARKVEPDQGKLM